MNSRFAFIILLTFILFLESSCQNRSERIKNPVIKAIKPPIEIKQPIKELKNVYFYIENSGSVFGYVRTFSEYVSVISELSEKPEFVVENINRNFYFINGNDLQITPIGSNPRLLRNRLNVAGYNCGDILHSDLNEMFQVALSKAGGDKISILISDGIYDIGREDAPFNALATEGKETRSKFLERLNNGDIQTILVKLNSSFNGDYCYASRPGRISINHSRPYYIWIFGESALLNKYFPENYIATQLTGYESMVRFFSLKQVKVPSQATSQSRIGNFKFDKHDRNKLKDVEMDRNGQGFRIAIAVDYSSLPLSDSYFCSLNNYNCSGNFKVVEVQKVGDKKIYDVNSFTPTHLIVVLSKTSPYGNLSVNLKNTLPSWISETHSTNEYDIETNVSQTFGFNHLIKGISDAYQFISAQENIVTFKIEINK